MSLGYFEFLSSVALAIAYASYEESIRKTAESGFSQFATCCQYSSINCLSKKKLFPCCTSQQHLSVFFCSCIFFTQTQLGVMFFFLFLVFHIVVCKMSGGKKKEYSLVELDNCFRICSEKI